MTAANDAATDLGRWSARQPDAEAVVIVDADGVRPAERVTYGDLDAAANRLARALRRAGLRRDDRVAFVLGNEAAVFVVFWAAMRTGLHVVPVNRHLLAPEIRYILEDAEVGAVIGSPSGGTAWPEAITGLPGLRLALAVSAGAVPNASGPPLGTLPFDDALAGEPSDPLDDAEEGQLLLYSSGTTGRPKGILRPLPGFGPGQGPTTGSEIADGFGLVAGDRYLSTGPLYHSAPFAFSTAQQRIGATAVVMTRFDAGAALRVLVGEHITTSQWVPTMFSRFLALPDPVREAFHAPRHRLAIHAAAPCPVGVKRRMIEWWGPILLEYYSSSEGGRTLITSQEWLARPGSVGRHWRGGRVWILDESGESCPPGVVGRVFFDAPPEPFRFRYVGDPEKTAAAYDAAGTRFSVGDVGWLDDDGYLFLTDRDGDLILTGGVNIYPREAENVLVEHQAVADAAVVGLSDADLGQRAVAVVVPAAGIEPDPALAEALLAHCRAHLARYKCPREVRFQADLPRSEAGKIVKRDLRRALEEADGRQTVTGSPVDDVIGRS
ncbi:MAG TPA: AMP-binding protein [Acidimicrobiia bacterium]|nr:AMP-binding protein [Acidimicrobiia bacterium]